MENPCKLVCFGDSITRGYAPVLENRFRERYTEIELDFVNAGTDGETSLDGLDRAGSIASGKPDVVVVCFGMNDMRRSVNISDFKKNISAIVDIFERSGARAILTTFNPVRKRFLLSKQSDVKRYNDAIRNVARAKRVKLADVNAEWNRRSVFRRSSFALADEIHPDGKGIDIYCDVLLRVIPRRNITVLWEFNGNPCECNYRCPYCSQHSKTGDHFFGDMNSWKDAFKRSFGNQHLTFYISFGEPMLAGKFYDLIDMIASEKNWEMMMTSNLSAPLDKIVNSTLARENRLNINTSFHPTETDIGPFIKKLLFLREHGIESPVIYVMYPPFFNRVNDDISEFSRNGFLVHLRRYEGMYKGKCYPAAYTDEERRFMAAYSDDANIKYMLNNRLTFGDMTYTGIYYMVVDNAGNIGWNSDYFPEYSKDRCRFGNVLQNNIKLLLEPMPFPGYTPYGTVDGVANIVELDYRELEGNHVISFMRQGGVYHDDKGNPVYGNIDTDFTDSSIRADYGFPARNIKDIYYIMKKTRKCRYLRILICRFLHKVHRFLAGSRFGWIFSD